MALARPRVFPTSSLYRPNSIILSGLAVRMLRLGSTRVCSIMLYEEKRRMVLSDDLSANDGIFLICRSDSAPYPKDQL